MQLRDRHDRFQNAGWTIVVIGMGTPVRTCDFRRELDLPFPVLCDPERRAYRAYGLGSLNLLREMGLRNITRLLRRTRRHGARRTGDQDMMQLGGTFLVSTDGVITVSYPARTVSDIEVPELLLQGDLPPASE